MATANVKVGQKVDVIGKDVVGTIAYALIVLILYQCNADTIFSDIFRIIRY